eukprot:snap_masked-scaffold_9-processed-gene-8.48-mRNA-1 protein AED:0.45 eAED:0.60 QI:0/-1/0/1/-1/1/1/0/276
MDSKYILESQIAQPKELLVKGNKNVRVFKSQTNSFLQEFGEFIALKEIKLSSKDQQKQAQNEVNILKQLRHKNIVNFIGCCWREDKFYIIQELLEVDFQTFLEGKCRVIEKYCKIIIKQIIEALRYLSTKNVVHRDIKLENVMFSDVERKEVKLIDFGLARVVNEKTKLNDYCGSKYYIAPEVIKCRIDKSVSYSFPVDIWGAGVITYLLLNQKAPFEETELCSCEKATLIHHVKFDSTKERNYSSEARKFIKRCLQKVPSKRITPSDALNHEWFF